MRERIGRTWRLCATGLCFAVFGLGGLLLGLAVFPMLHAVVRSDARRIRAARSIIHRLFRMFVAMMRATGVLTFEVRGLERLQGANGRLILANHPTLIDVVLLMSLIEGSDCVVKSELGRNPFTRGPVRAAGFVFNDGPESLVDACVNSVRTGSNLIIFPEGTRTSRTEPMRLHRGAARVAVHGEVDILPVQIRCTPPTLAKGEQWYRVPPRRPHFCIAFDEPIAVSSFIADAPSHALAARRLNRHLTDYFSRGQSLASA